MSKTVMDSNKLSIDHSESKRYMFKKLKRMLLPNMQNHFKKNVKSMTFVHKASVIRQKGESQNGCFKKTKNISFPPDTHTYVYRQVLRPKL